MENLGIFSKLFMDDILKQFMDNILKQFMDNFKDTDIPKIKQHEFRRMRSRLPVLCHNYLEIHA